MVRSIAALVLAAVLLVVGCSSTAAASTGGGSVGGEVADPGHDHQHPGLGPARRAAAAVHPGQRMAGQDARRGQRPGHRTRAPRRSRRAARALAGRGAGFRGRGHGRAAAAGDAQRLRARRAAERPRAGPRLDSTRGHEDRRCAGAVRPRGDDSGTNAREKDLWAKAGITPEEPGTRPPGRAWGRCCGWRARRRATPCRTGPPTWPSATRSRSTCSARATPAC